MRTTFYTLITLILLSFTSIAQKDTEFILENFQSKSDYEEALKYLFSGDDYFADGIEWYDLALQDYIKASEYNPNNALLNYNMGVCYYYANDNFKSLKYYNKAYELNPNVNEIVLYRIGQGYQFRLQFDKAIDLYNQFITNYKGKEKKEWTESVNKRIEECNNGKDLIKNFVGGMVVNIQKVNSKYIDHSPLITTDESTMFFTSRRPSINIEDVDDQGRSYEDIFYSTKDKNGNWQEAVNIGAPINTNNHDATIGISPDGKKLYIYDGKKNGGDILVSSFVDSAWTTPVALPAPINTKHQETAISFSPDGQLAYFVSDRPNGVGGKDIWVSEVSGNKFKTPKPLSTVINTPYDERAVFIHPDGKTMYFSSEGHKTMGGFDIFKSVKDGNGEWGAPENIGYPVNTTGDDVFFVTSADNKRGYFSSLKLNSKGEQDIYMYVFPEEETNSEFVIVRGIVRDENSKKPIPATLSFTDTESGEVISISTDPETGEFLASIPRDKNYAVNVTASGYTLLSESINPESDETKEFLLSLDMSNQASCKPIVLNNVWFEFDKADLKSESFAELDQLVTFLSGCDQYKAEIAGYTCTSGQKEYNYILSKRRAESVVKYLIEKGIPADRITAKGYGPENPIANNETHEGRIKNRRVEFKLVQE